MARDTILFDINETVLDLASLRPLFAEAFGEANVAATWFATLLQSSTVCAITGVRTTFAELAGHALDRLAAVRGVNLTDDRRGAILGAFASLPPHDDVAPALDALRSAGYRTVAFTNSSRDLVTTQMTNSGLMEKFDSLVSVEDTGSFKPDGRVYAFVAERLERAPDDLRLVAAHDWDTHGALTAGLRAAYVDRSGAPYHPLYKRPDVFGRSMAEVARHIVAVDRAG